MTRSQHVSICLLHTKDIRNHYTLQVRYVSIGNLHRLYEQANAMTQPAQSTGGAICLHQLQHTNYPDYRAVWVYMSVCLGVCETERMSLCVSVLACFLVHLCVPVQLHVSVCVHVHMLKCVYASKCVY